MKKRDPTRRPTQNLSPDNNQKPLDKAPERTYDDGLKTIDIEEMRTQAIVSSLVQERELQKRMVHEIKVDKVESYELGGFNVSKKPTSLIENGQFFNVKNVPVDTLPKNKITVVPCITNPAPPTARSQFRPRKSGMSVVSGMTPTLMTIGQTRDQAAKSPDRALARQC